MVVVGGLGAAAAPTFDNIERVLEQAGADFSQIVKINAFITDLDEYADYAAVRERRFGDKLPASATVQVAGLLVGAHIEIDAVAFVADD
jgi:2-iminobutanoate/2-iminopropanoate deaminase